MPEKQTVEAARQDEREGKSPSTQAGEFVREEIHHVREGKHGARSPKQAIAIGLSKARRAGVKLAPPKEGKASFTTRQKAERDLREGQAAQKRTPSAKRSRAVSKALKQEGHAAASRKSLAKEARGAAQLRGTAARRRAAIKAVQTKGKAGVKQSAEGSAYARKPQAGFAFGCRGKKSPESSRIDDILGRSSANIIVA